MEKEHQLRVTINAESAKSGAREFVGAVNAIKNAVKGLERDTTGAFTKLQRGAKLRVDTSAARKAKENIAGMESGIKSYSNAARRSAISAKTALRVSQVETQRLSQRLNALGDTAGITKLNGELDRLKAKLATATSPLDSREVRANFMGVRDDLKRRAVDLERVAREESAAAGAVAHHATELERLRSKYNPIYAASQRYESALNEINMAEREGAITAKLAADARTRAATELQTGTAQMGRYGAAAQTSKFHTANLAAQFNDVGVMLASGQSPLLLAVQQGTQISQVLNQLDGKGGVLKTLGAGFASMVNPVSLITIGVIAFGAAAYQAITKAIPETVTFKDALDDLNESIDAVRDSASKVNDLEALRDSYGAVTREVQRLVEVQEKLARLDTVNDLRAARDALYSDQAGVGWMASLAGYADTAGGRTRRLRDELDLTWKSAAQLESMFQKSRGMESARAMADQYAAMRQVIIDAAGGVENLTAEQVEAVKALTQAEHAARRFVAPIADATNESNAWAGALSGVRSEVDAIMSSLSNIGAGAVSNVAKEAEIAALAAGKSVKDAAIARKRAEKEREFAAREQAAQAKGGIAGWVQGQLIESERYQFEKGLRLDQQLDAGREKTRKAAREAAREARKAEREARKEKKTDFEKMTESLSNRVDSINQQTTALKLLATGQFETTAGAQAMAQAMAVSGGAVDEQTAAMVRQIDAAAALNEKLSRLSRDPVKAWVDSVPTWTEAGRKIETEALGSLSDELAKMIKTGEFSFESLGESILSTAADVISDMAVREMLVLLGAGGQGNQKTGFGLGGGLQKLFGHSAGSILDPGNGGAEVQAAMQVGGVEAGQSIAQAMIGAGNQVAANMSGAPGIGIGVGLGGVGKGITNYTTRAGGSAMANGIIEAANALGVDAKDLATVISYETAGTFNPTKAGPTTKWGQHRGLIQFGEQQAQQYGVDWANPLNSQLGADGAIVKYMRAAGLRPGMGLLDMYSTVNAGAPGRYGASDAAAGGAPGSVLDKVSGMGGHMAKAESLLSGHGVTQGMTLDGTQAATQLQNALKAGGQNLSYDLSDTLNSSGQRLNDGLRQAGTQTAQQMGTQVTTAGTTSGAMMGSQVTMAGATSGAQMSTSVQTGGSSAAMQMQNAVASGGQQAASMMAQATATSGGAPSGGGLFGGGFGGIAMTVGMSLVSSLFNKKRDRPEPDDGKDDEWFNAQSYAIGTPNTSRDPHAIPAMIHDSEAIIPLPGNRKVPVEMKDGEGRGATVVNVTQNISTPDADSFRRSQAQIAKDAYQSGARAAAGIG